MLILKALTSNFAIFGSLLICIPAILLPNFLNEQRNLLRTAHQQVMNATRHTIMQSNEIINRIEFDETLLQNLDWQLDNSANKSLSSYIQSSPIHHVGIFTKDCKEVAGTSSYNAALLSCNKIIGEEGLQWHKGNGFPVLAVTKKIARDNQQRYILAQINFDDKWIKFYPGVLNIWNRLNLQFVEGGQVKLNKPLISVGPSGYENLFYIISNNKLMKLIPSYLPLTENLSNYFSVFLIGLVLILLFLRKFVKDTQLDFQKMVHSNFISSICKNYTSGSPVANFASFTPEIGKKIIEEIQLKLHHKDEEISLCKAKIENLEEEVFDLSKNNKELKFNLNQVSDPESVHAQVFQFAKKLNEKTSSLEEHSQDIVSILTTGLVDNGNKLSELLLYWKKNIEAKGARKFLRSLSETEDAITNKNQLDMQIDVLLSLIVSVTDQSVAAKIHAQNLYHEATIIKEVTSHWANLTSTKEMQASPESFIQIKKGIHALLSFDPKFNNIEININNNQDIPYMTVAPLRAWISSFYHVINAINEAVEDRNLTKINLIFKQKDNNSLIVVTTNNFDTINFNWTKESSRKHLQMANKTLKPYHVICEHLFTMSKNPPITLMWQSHMKPISDHKVKYQKQMEL